MKTVKFRSFSDLPSATFSPCGEKIYKYKYLDKKDGKLKEGERNMDEMIQSSLPKTEYKKLYEQGERFNDDGSGIYLDTAKYGNDFDSISNYFKGLADSIREKMQGSVDIGIQQTVQQSKEQVAEVSATSGSDTKESGKTGGEQWEFELLIKRLCKNCWGEFTAQSFQSSLYS